MQVMINASMWLAGANVKDHRKKGRKLLGWGCANFGSHAFPELTAVAVEDMSKAPFHTSGIESAASKGIISGATGTIGSTSGCWVFLKEASASRFRRRLDLHKSFEL